MTSTWSSCKIATFLRLAPPTACLLQSSFLPFYFFSLLVVFFLSFSFVSLSIDARASFLLFLFPRAIVIVVASEGKKVTQEREREREKKNQRSEPVQRKWRINVNAMGQELQEETWSAGRERKTRDAHRYKEISYHVKRSPEMRHLQRWRLFKLVRSFFSSSSRDAQAGAPSNRKMHTMRKSSIEWL